MSTVARSSAKFVRLSHLRQLRGCQQVAAVCYRVRNLEIQFLLVRTRGSGRWTFPKGSAEPGLTHAQAAALEAFEEAGVHGRMEEASFATYLRRKPGASRKTAVSKGVTVNAYLCEVTRLEAPQEFDRNPTWHLPEKAKACLREDREAGYGADLARIVDRAVARIRSRVTQVRQPPVHQQKDGLQKVQFIDCAWRAINEPKNLSGSTRRPRQFLQ